MNYKLMLRMLGRTLQVEALCLIIPMLVALYYREDPLPFLYTILPVGILGTLLARLRSNAEFFSQEGFTVVGLIWLSFCLFGALPFWFSGEFASFADCFFESASGFTTTGGTILPDIESLPRSILFWRAFSSWVGGMGVLIFTMAFLPKVGGRSQMLFRAEVPGPVSTKLVPQTAHASQILYLMYFVLTGAEFIALRTAGSIKCGRILLLLRSSTRSLLRLSHPRAIKVVKLDGKAVSEETLRSVFSFFTCYFLLLGLGTIVVSLDGHSLTTSFTATLGCLSNVGPGLDTVGPLASFSPLSEFNKVFLSLFMLIGRLEIFPILLLFHPSTWRRS